MYKCKYPNLFSPIVLGNTLFRNRIFAAPTGYQNVLTVNGNAYINDGAGAYYGRKAMGGAASVATFGTMVDGEFGRAGDWHPALDMPGIWRPLTRVAFAIKDHGAVASLEIQHTGMYANRTLSFYGAKPWGEAYGPVECELDGRIVRAMDEEMIERTIRKYAEAAALAKRCGFGMITVHAGHGWLLHQFLSPKTNTRTDKWGGFDIENRARLAVAACDAMRKAVGPGFPIEIRISGSECYDGGYDVDEGVAIARQLDGHVDLIHVTAGHHEVEEVFPVAHPSMFHPDGCNVKHAAEIKKHVNTPVATVGALSDPELMEDIIASGKADVVQVARALICDPDFPKKVRAGIEPRRCLRCLACFSNLMGSGQTYCAINPETGRELELRYTPVTTKKKVLVVGGGVGGMQAALTCVQRGHEVILCEKNSRLGGVLRCEQDVEFKKNLIRYLDQQEELLKNSGVDLRLNIEVTPKYAEALHPDVIIAALGATPQKPDIPGIYNTNVMSALEAYKSPGIIGQNVVIIGAGLVGVELGLHLCRMNRRVRVVEILDRINDGGNFLHIPGLKVEAKKRGLEIEFCTNTEEITTRGITVSGGRTIEADTVIYAAGMTPEREKAAALGFCTPEFYMIGDCVTPRSITEATTEGFMAARNL